MKTIAVIPARGKSKRLPNKNILMLGGIPLLAHSILYAQTNSVIFDAIYVTTDDATIKKIALEYGAIVIDRPADISGDLEPTVSALQHVLQTISTETEDLNIVLLQPTNPLRPENLLVEAFETYQNNNCESLFTVTRNHQKFGKIVNNQFMPFNYSIGQRSQDLDPLYFENGLLYIIKAKSVTEGKIISENSIPYEVNHIFGHVDIDTQTDLDYANFLIKNK